jgi:uncharacterized protein YbdZ (MbtH family)
MTTDNPPCHRGNTASPSAQTCLIIHAESRQISIWPAHRPVPPKWRVFSPGHRARHSSAEPN